MARSCCIHAMALLMFPTPQCALLSEENTDPRSFRLQVPMRSADSSSTSAPEYSERASSDWPITEMITNGLWSSFMRCSCAWSGTNSSGNNFASFDVFKNKFLHIKCITLFCLMDSIFYFIIYNFVLITISCNSLYKLFYI